MRLGGPLHEKYSNPEEWVNVCRKQGFSAAQAPVGPDAEESVIEEYREAAQEADIVIAEVGAWSNPLSTNPEEREKALEKCRKALIHAEKIGARCCVNTSGSRGDKWAGHHKDNITDETFGMIVGYIQKIIDEVQPETAFYTLETMPWMYPDSVDSYDRLIQAIDRKAFGVHFDPVNLVNSVDRYYSNSSLIENFCTVLGPRIKSCHAKDSLLSQKLTIHLDEVQPGTGNMDYGTFIREIEKLDKDMPLMLEHLPNREEYEKAAEYIRKVAEENSVVIKLPSSATGTRDK